MIPIQALTGLLYVGVGLIATLLFLNGNVKSFEPAGLVETEKLFIIKKFAFEEQA